MRVTVTGATGLIGSNLVGELLRRGDEVTVLSRSPDRARQNLVTQAVGWDPLAGPAPAAGLAGRDAVVHLAGEGVAQRWTADAKRAIRDSRTVGTANLVAGIRGAQPRPPVLVSASAVGYYGDRGDERLDEGSDPGEGFLAEVCVGWERAAGTAADLGLRVASLRTGVVLDRRGGALKQMLTPFSLGVGGPVAGGRQYVPWIHLADVIGLLVSAVDGDAWSGPLNATAPNPVTNRELSRALGRALRRPAVTPVPALALRALYGEMAEIVTGGQRALPARPLSLGYRFRHGDLEGALRAALER